MRTLFTILVLAFLVSGCAGRHVKRGDALAKKGQWEEALQAYRAAHARKETAETRRRIEKAEREIAGLYIQRGFEAKSQGDFADAGDWWRKALELRPRDTGAGSPWQVITDHADELERFAVESVEAERYELAFRAYDPLLLIFPERLDLIEKSQSAHRSFANRLTEEGDALAERGLTGAALVRQLRALRHDPLHPTAFDTSTALRRQMHAAARVAVDEVTLDDGGWWGVGQALLPPLEAQLGAYPPYGPTKDKKAARATFLVTVEEFAWWDTHRRGVELRTDESETSGGGDPAPHPARKAWETVVTQLEQELAAMEALRADAEAAKLEEAKGEVSPGKGNGKGNAKGNGKSRAKGKDKRPGKGLANGKGKATADAEEADARTRVPPPRVPSSEELESKRAEIEAARTKLAAIPESVDGATAAKTWTLPWIDSERTVEVRVRFELKEADLDPPISIVLTRRAQAKDRHHAGDEDHLVPADPKELPTVDVLVDQIAGELATGIKVIENARARRAETLIERGRDAWDRGERDEAVDAYVRALFITGPERGPEEVGKLLAKQMESEGITSLLIE